MTHLSSALPVHGRFGLAASAVIFAAGLSVGAAVTLSPYGAKAPSVRAPPTAPAVPAAGAATPSAGAEGATRLAYPADVVRVIDGDTFEARVRVWPGLDVVTKVRLRNIDAPELHARCADELEKAQAARAALEKMLAAGGVTISRVGIDKYGGRVDAAAATRDEADVSAALLSGGWARSYEGGRRRSWC